MQTTRMAAIALAGCLTAGGCGGGDGSRTERIERIRTEVEALAEAQAAAGYASWTTGAPSRQDSLYAAHPDLFSPDAIRLVEEALGEEQDALQKKRLRYLRRHLVAEYLNRGSAPLADSAADLEARAAVRSGGEVIPYRNLGARIAHELRQERRAALYAAADPVLDSLNLLLRRAETRRRTLGSELGYHSPESLASELKGYSLRSLGRTAERVLRETEEPYRTLLAEMVRRYLGLEPEEFHRYDAALLLRGGAFDGEFPAGGLLEAGRKTWRGMGVHLDSLRGLGIDDAPRPEKNPRAVCFTVAVPTDIRLSIKPIGGRSDYDALFHELGHALHYAHTAEFSAEFRYLGEGSLTEAYAFLSQYLLTNQAWLRLHSRMSSTALKEYVRFRVFERLYMLRRYCAKLLFELDFSDGISNPEAAYAGRLAAAAGAAVHPSDGRRYLVETDALFYTASYLRGWFLEAQLNGYLTRTYGANWFENPGAGGFLRTLWEQGDRLEGDEAARRAHFPEVAPEPLLEHLRLMLLFTARPSGAAAR
ncbi:MAG: hypothetical protein WB626_09060 [Bacteroidota bacterium]